ncbi:hypothetical protein BJ170DRAFT_403125 [Xylariales sp. AK1849]|nr:hypothetical protein BJ170DRAFT_403125 [Xylariales sp. AK1849]
MKAKMEDRNACHRAVKKYHEAPIQSRGAAWDEASKPFLEKMHKIPAIHPKVICVGGFSKADEVCTEYYNGTAIDIYAPAIDMPWVTPDGHIRDSRKVGLLDKTENGTSYATPLVSGAIACLLSQDRTIPTDTIRDRLKGMARKVGDGHFLCLAKQDQIRHVRCISTTRGECRWNCGKLGILMAHLISRCF